LAAPPPWPLYRRQNANSLAIFLRRDGCREHSLTRAPRAAPSHVAEADDVGRTTAPHAVAARSGTRAAPSDRRGVRA